MKKLSLFFIAFGMLQLFGDASGLTAEMVGMNTGFSEILLWLVIVSPTMLITYKYKRRQELLYYLASIITSAAVIASVVYILKPIYASKPDIAVQVPLYAKQLAYLHIGAGALWFTYITYWRNKMFHEEMNALTIKLMAESISSPSITYRYLNSWVTPKELLAILSNSTRAAKEYLKQRNIEAEERSEAYRAEYGT